MGNRSFKAGNGLKKFLKPNKVVCDSSVCIVGNVILKYAISFQLE